MTNSLTKFTSLILSGAIVLALAACDGNDPPDPPPPGSCEDTDPDSLECAIELGEVAYDTTGSIVQIQDFGNGLAPRANEVTWSNEYEYLLDGRVFVNEGQTLTIEPGTVVRAEGGQGTAASALVVARGGAIMAEGTADNPIIFTAEADPLDGSLGTNRGLWGGVVILGHASTNTVPGVQRIEGIPDTEPRGAYGCGDDFSCDDNDNSGVFRYVSIRHAGTEIGAGNELNGLTMGGVGDATTIEYVEVFANLDDGFEWFGGTVNTKYLVVGFNGDDMFDYDQGWRGLNQFWFGIKPTDLGGNLGEHDGGTDPETGEPYATPRIYNATFIGSGASSGSTNGIIFRDNAGGYYYNSIFTEAAGYAIAVEDLGEDEGSRDRLEAGDLVLQNNLFGHFGAGTDATDMFISTDGDGNNDGGTWLANYMTDAEQENVSADPMLSMICWEVDCGLDPRPSGSSPALSMSLQSYDDTFFTSVDYAGAFGPGDTWMNGWTALNQYGYINM